MNPELTKTFIQHYIESLHERTRDEKAGAKWGFDWIIYNLGLALYGKPVRLPFRRGEEGDYAKTKTESEQGVDLSFLSEDEQKLTIFVLKKVPLTNRNWTDADFDRDLRMAMNPDLKSPHLVKIRQVEVILAYNKDEDQNGLRAYELFVDNASKTLGGGATLSFARWNLSDLVSLTLQHLLSPALVPQKFFGQLNYLCAQTAEFRHGSDEWEQQLLPAWKRLLSDLLEEGEIDRAVPLVPVVLLIVRQQARDNRSIRTGMFDLTEWAAISLWRAAAKHESIKNPVVRFWLRFYLLELRSFYEEQMPFLSTPQSIDQVTQGSFVGTIAASYLGYWHAGRLGLLALGLAEVLPDATPEAKSEKEALLQEVARWMEQLIQANTCLYRPFLDIQHIEVFLIFLVFLQTHRLLSLERFLLELVNRLYLRRIANRDLPFIDAHNSLENVFEQVATKPAAPVVTTSSSFFVLMLLELSCALPSHETLLALIHRRLVLGAFDEGDPGGNEPLDLISWIAPADWDPRIFSGQLNEDGESISTRPFSDSREATGRELFEAVQKFVQLTRQHSKVQFVRNTPIAALMLASLRYGSPVPPELWRAVVFPESPPAPTPAP
ncbi:hypothetical protein OH491_19615 [Termitidicoccus mucosus]|uniref:Uncharacterized protein n=1 Tax=Termitidicoccus mucosus TaxID=1184151 RepID=A0A178IFY0_9BACT|nr:hypothetical protein AW736_09065 [Opitutaceae bacterium TSB47]